MPLLGQAQKLVVVLVLIVAILAMVVGLFIGHGLTLIQLDTSTHTAQFYGWSGVPMNPDGQFLDASQYVTSWKTDGTSEKIVPKASEAFAWPGTACVKEYRTRAYLTHDGALWSEMAASPWTYGAPAATGPGPFPLNTPPITLTGPYVGGIKVTEELHIADAYCLLDKGWLEVLSDQAYLVPGVGKISAPAQAQVGQTIQVRTSVAYLTSTISPGKGWQFYGYSAAQGKVVVGPYELTQLEQSFSYKLVSADFSSSAGCDTPNRLEWHLFNELWEKDFSFTTTVDVSSLSPSLSIPGYTGDPVANGTITLQLSASPNPTTLFPIQKIVVAYGFGGINNELNLTGNATTAPVPLGQSGNLHVEAYAVDTACRPSPAARIDISVHEPGGGNGGLKPNWLVFFAVLVVFTGVGAVIAYAVKGPLWVRIMVLALFILIGVVAAVFIVPTVLNPALYAIFPWGGG